jgi:hypothetical protein
MLDANQIATIQRLHWIEKRSLRSIATHLHSTFRTIKKYLLSSGRPGIRAPRHRKLDPYKPIISELLQQDSAISGAAIGRHLRASGYQGGLSILGEHLRHVHVIASQSPILGGRQKAFDWMRAVLQRALSRGDLATELGQVAELDELLSAVWEGNLSHRNRAMTVLARERGIGQSHACSFLHISKGTATRYWNHYQQGGQSKLLARREMRGTKSKNDDIKQAVFGLLHTPPSAHGINRSTWRFTDLQKVLRSQGQPLCCDVI